MTLSQLQKEYVTLSSPKVKIEDFYVLASHFLKRPKTALLAHPESPLSPEEEREMRKALIRRLRNEPIAYILGHKEFFGRDFTVTKDTLIPRPETELMIEEILEYVERFLQSSQMLSIVDVGTGSGNIIITLREKIKKDTVRFFGLDISSKAIAVAKKNEGVRESDTPIVFLKSDLLKNLNIEDVMDGSLIIAANLPYLSHGIYKMAESDVKDYEPRSALVSEEQGLEHYYRLLKEAKRFSRTFSSVGLFFEISPEQSSLIMKRIEEEFPEMTVTVLKDLSGKERLIKAIK